MLQRIRNAFKNDDDDDFLSGIVEYERDGVHTNPIESLWALVKRVYIGIHHHWSEKHMQRYLDACVFRINRKKVSTVGRVDDLLSMAMGARLTYKELIA